jgi:hypothetical protein
VAQGGKIATGNPGTIHKVNFTDHGMRQATSVFQMLQKGMCLPNVWFCTALILVQRVEVDSTPAGFRDFAVQTRLEISNRRLSNQSCIVNVGDEQRQTSQVAHTAWGSGITEGVPVSFTVVSVVEVI